MGSISFRLPSGGNGSRCVPQAIELGIEQVGSTPMLARLARSSLRCGLRGKPNPTARTRIENPVEVAPWHKWTHGKRRRTASEQSELQLIHYIAKRLLTSESSGLRLRLSVRPKTF